MKKRTSYIKTLYRKLFTNLKSKYRIVVMDLSYHEKLALKLSRMQVWWSLCLLVLVVMVFTICMILFTPLRQFVPGYTREELIEEVYGNRMQLDSLQEVVEGQKLMLQLLQASVEGRVPPDEAEMIKDSLKDYSQIEYRHSVSDSLLRKEIEEASAYQISTVASLREQTSFSDNLLFFTPVNGNCVRTYDPSVADGIEIACTLNETVKASLDGYVVFTDWSPALGYVILVQHENHLLTVYAQNTALLKRRGDFVEAGEAIAMAGKRLRFELWYNGFPMNPQNYLTF